MSPAAETLNIECLKERPEPNEIHDTAGAKRTRTLWPEPKINVNLFMCLLESTHILGALVFVNSPIGRLTLPAAIAGSTAHAAELQMLQVQAAP